MPSGKITVPVDRVPVVVRFSLPKLIAPVESVMDPFANVSVAKLDPVANVCAPLNANVPPKVPEPSTIKFSFMFILVESGELMDVPPKASPAMITLPAPLGVIFRSSFDLVRFDVVVFESKGGEHNVSCARR